MNGDRSDDNPESLDPTKSMHDLSGTSGSDSSSASARARQLDPGDVLGERFTIIQFLARGGMGEVYEASDSHLQDKHCALKTLRGDISADPVVRQRFEREVLLAREVSHPNVCPTFDLFRVDGPRGPVMFLTMKLLRGESLSKRMKRSGSFELEAALPIIRQMAEALDAAHRSGVIHRDFKPGNVMLESTGPDVRVSITDFGLSRAYEADTTLGETGRISGTIGYLAPEILQGRLAIPASDVYAFGVVLHEMITGKRPVNKPGRTSFVRPSNSVEGLPDAWDRMILGCLEADPARRFQSAGEALSTIEARSSSTRSLVLRAQASRRRRKALTAAIAALIILVGWWFFPGLDAILHPLPQKRFVALMPWPADSDPVYRPLLKNILDTTGRRIARAEPSTRDLLVISTGDVVTGQPALRGPGDAEAVLGANLVLGASLHASGGQVRLALVVLDSATQKVLRRQEIAVAAPELNRLPEKASIAGAKLLDVRVAQNSVRDRDELANVSPAAFQLFNGAEDLFGQPNNAGLDRAIEEYQKVLDAEPRFALGYARISMAYVRKYQASEDPAVLSLAAKNADLALRYNPDSARAVLSRVLVDVNSGRAVQALEELEQARKLDPADPQIPLARARAFRVLDRRAEEEDVYRAVLKERPNYWPAYNELGWILYRHGSYQKAADAFALGSAVAPRVSLLQSNLGTMYLLLGRKKDAEQAFVLSLEGSPSALAYQNLGSIAFEDGDYRKALDYYRKALALKPKDDANLRNIADCYTMLGDAPRALEHYSQAAAILAESLRTNPLRGTFWMKLAFYDAKLGRRDAAESDLRNAATRGASDMQSQFVKAQALAVMGRKEEALQQVLACMAKGLSRLEVDLALDLKEVRKDPRYLRQVSQAGTGK